jgi:uncharacterized membrane protein YphA (DoxX/SURF4 family)/thiol-disulfide isomerase/thioredoxin
MDLALLALRLGLAIVFGTAGLAKLLDRSGTRQTLVSFGAPEPLGRVGAVALPVAELAVAGALLVPGSARWGALAALGLLIVFIGGIANALAHGRSPDCHCFGQLHSTPASRRTIGRNVVLALVAAVVAVAGSHEGELGVGLPEVVTITVVAAVVVVLAVLPRAHSWLPEPLRARIEDDRRLTALARAASRVGLVVLGGARPQAQGLPVGDSAPEFQVHDLENARVTLRELQKTHKPTLLIFSDPGCRPCLELLPEIARWQQENDKGLRIAVITSGPHPADRAENGPYTVKDVLVQQDREVQSAYAVRDTPSAVLVTADGSIGSPVAVGAEAIAALVDRIAN